MVAGSRAAQFKAPAHLPGLLDAGLRRVAQRSLRRLARYSPIPATYRAKGLGIAIQPLLSGNADLARDFYRGRFAFSGTVVECNGQVIFEHKAPERRWTEELHGFSWLAHSEAGNRELLRVHSRSLISDWIAGRKQHDPIAWETSIMSRRLISWIQHSGFLVHGSPDDFHLKFLTSLTRQLRRLNRAAGAETDLKARLDAAIALNYATLGLSGLEPLRGTAFSRLERELDVQILPDGGHISRNPATLLNILLDLVPLRAALEQARLAVPEALNTALERMLPMLRFFCHGDGGLAVFNGVNDHMAGRARAVLEADQVQGRPLTRALHSGYSRLAEGSSLVIAETGRPAAPGLNNDAASGPLAFEFSDRANRIVVNCGMPLIPDPDWQAAVRMTPAHSTVCLNESSAGQMLDNSLTRQIFGTPALIGPGLVDAKLAKAGEGSVLRAQHDGYEKAFGIVIERDLFLASTGDDLRGEDRFVASPDYRQRPDIPFAVRFHLHPSVKATLSQDGASIMLVLPDKRGWRFTAKGGRLALEDSIYLPGKAGARQSWQIVVHGIAGRPDRVHWAFKRIVKRKPASERREAAPELPL